MFEKLMLLDRQLFLFLNAMIANPVFDLIFTHITNRDFWIVPIIIAGTIFIIKQKKKALIVIGLALVTVAITDPLCVRVIKEVVHRHRPCDPCCLVEGGRFLLGFKDSLSFPSAHAMNVFGQATLFSLLYPKRTVWFVLVASLIAFSRVYVGVHYPLDVMAGAVLGGIIGAGVYAGYKQVLRVIARSQPSGKDPASHPAGHERAVDPAQEPS